MAFCFWLLVINYNCSCIELYVNSADKKVFFSLCQMQNLIVFFDHTIREGFTLKQIFIYIVTDVVN